MQPLDPHAERAIEADTTGRRELRIPGRDQKVVHAVPQRPVEDLPSTGADVLQQQPMLTGQVAPREIDDASCALQPPFADRTASKPHRIVVAGHPRQPTERERRESSPDTWQSPGRVDDK